MELSEDIYFLDIDVVEESEGEDSQSEEEPNDEYDDEHSQEEIEQRFGGYEYEFVDEVLQNQNCPVCLLPMRDAVQTSDCGHRFCRDCLDEILRWTDILHLSMKQLIWR